MKIKTIALALVFFAGLLFYFGSVARAEDSETSTSGSNISTVRPTETPENKIGESTRTPEPSESPEASESPKSRITSRVEGEDRLTDKRLRFCENHKEEIDNRLTSLGNLVFSMLGKFDAIAARVEEFYTTKAEPAGKIVSNYSALVADIKLKRDAVTTALSDSQDSISGFSCTATNPKGQIRLFKTDMQNVKKSLQDYRTSIKNLIVAIRSVVGETNNESPKPSEAPEIHVSPSPVASPI